jgi:hypothetical protein
MLIVASEWRAWMPHPALRCPNCGQHGYVIERRTGEIEPLVGAACHLCGHLLRSEEVERSLDEYQAELAQRVLKERHD